MTYPDHQRNMEKRDHTAAEVRPAVGSVAPDPLELLTPQQLCGLLQVRLSWIYDEVEAGRLPVVRLGRQLRFRRGDVACYLDSTAVA